MVERYSVVASFDIVVESSIDGNVGDSVSKEMVERYSVVGSFEVGVSV